MANRWTLCSIHLRMTATPYSTSLGRVPLSRSPVRPGVGAAMVRALHRRDSPRVVSSACADHYTTYTMFLTGEARARDGGSIARRHALAFVSLRSRGDALDMRFSLLYEAALNSQERVEALARLLDRRHAGMNP